MDAALAIVAGRLGSLPGLLHLAESALSELLRILCPHAYGTLIG